MENKYSDNWIDSQIKGLERQKDEENFLANADSLEQLLDSMGMESLLNALSNICLEKASHIRENWQDDDLAKVWERQAQVLHHTIIIVP